MTTIKSISENRREVTGRTETWVEIKCSHCGHWTPQSEDECVICERVCDTAANEDEDIDALLSAREDAEFETEGEAAYGRED